MDMDDGQGNVMSQVLSIEMVANDLYSNEATDLSVTATMSQYVLMNGEPLDIPGASMEQVQETGDAYFKGEDGLAYVERLGLNGKVTLEPTYENFNATYLSPLRSLTERDFTEVDENIYRLDTHEAERVFGFILSGSPHESLPPLTEEATMSIEDGRFVGFSLSFAMAVAPGIPDMEIAVNGTISSYDDVNVEHLAPRDEPTSESAALLEALSLLDGPYVMDFDLNNASKRLYRGESSFYLQADVSRDGLGEEDAYYAPNDPLDGENLHKWHAEERDGGFMLLEGGSSYARSDFDSAYTAFNPALFEYENGVYVLEIPYLTIEVLNLLLPGELLADNGANFYSGYERLEIALENGSLSSIKAFQGGQPQLEFGFHPYEGMPFGLVDGVYQGEEEYLDLIDAIRSLGAGYAYEVSVDGSPLLTYYQGASSALVVPSEGGISSVVWYRDDGNGDFDGYSYERFAWRLSDPTLFSSYYDTFSVYYQSAYEGNLSYGDVAQCFHYLGEGLYSIGQYNDFSGIRWLLPSYLRLKHFDTQWCEEGYVTLTDGLITGIEFNDGGSAYEISISPFEELPFGLSEADPLDDGTYDIVMDAVYALFDADWSATYDIAGHTGTMYGTGNHGLLVILPDDASQGAALQRGDGELYLYPIAKKGDGSHQIVFESKVTIYSEGEGYFFSSSEIANALGTLDFSAERFLSSVPATGLWELFRMAYPGEEAFFKEGIYELTAGELTGITLIDPEDKEIGTISSFGGIGEIPSGLEELFNY